MKVNIIGSGIAGLASAVRMACAGHDVDVFESNAYPGGKLTELEQNGYRFDAGPSLFTLPALVDELLILAGKNPREHFNYIQPERSCVYFYEDGTTFSAYHNRDKFAQELRDNLSIDDPTPVYRYLDRAALRYKLTAPVFIEYSLHRITNYTHWKTLKAIWNTGKLNLFSTMHRENQHTFRDPRLVQYFNRFATYNGSSPYMAPALLNMIPHLEHNIGSFFPKHGMHDITLTVYKLAHELGVKFHFNAKVNEITTSGNRVSGVRVGDTIYPSNIVISNADVYPTYNKLLPKEKQPKRILRQEKSSSAVIFYWGIKKQFPQLDLHNIFFSSNYAAEFDCLFVQKTMYKDPTVYVNITSKYKPDDAPVGCENWFVMVNAPNNSGQDWHNLIQQTREAIIQKLSRLLKTDISVLIEAEQILDPRSIESKTSSFAGALYGNASNSRFAAFLRHKNFSSHLKGLYFCGGSVHPGGGIPLCLNSAKIVSRLIAEDYN